MQCQVWRLLAKKPRFMLVSCSKLVKSGGNVGRIAIPRTQMTHILEDLTHKMEGQPVNPQKRGQLGSR